MGRRLSRLVRRLFRRLAGAAGAAGAARRRRRTTQALAGADEWLLRDVGAPQALIDAARADRARSSELAALRRLEGRW